MEAITPSTSTLAAPNLVPKLAGSSSQTSYIKRVKYFFFRLNLDYAPHCFPNLNKEKRNIMKSIL